MDRETIDLLVSLLSGRLHIHEFGQQLGDVLFELRQDITPSEDKQMLSRIQLYLHEFDEGNRDIREVYIAAQAALDLAKPSKRPVATKLTRVFALPIEAGAVVPSTASPPPEFSKLPGPVPI